MIDTADYNQSKIALIEILKREEAIRMELTGLDELTPEERRLLKSTAAAEVLLYSIRDIARGDADTAVEGLKALYLEKRLRNICKRG